MEKKIMEKNSVKKIKRAYLITVAALLVILAAVELVHSRNNEKQLSNRIVGSYMTQGTMDDTTYLVFTDQKNYTLYKQFRILGKGTYETENADHSRVYTLYESGKVSGNVILYGDTLYYIAKDSEAVTEMRKFSSTPDYININVDK